MKGAHRAAGLALAMAAALIYAGASLPQDSEQRPEPAPPPLEPGKKLIADLGCPICHEIAGHETTVREEAPDLSYEGELVRPEWLFAFLKSPTHIRPAIRGRMPDFRLSDQEALAITDYLASLKDDEAPVRAGEDRGGDLPSAAALLDAGKKLTSRDYLDCFKCHLLAGQNPGGDPSEWAPDLTRVRQRIEPAGFLSWVRNPSKYRPGTKMPVFFPDQDSGPEDILEGDEDRLILALREFVMSLGREGNAGEYREAREAFPEIEPSRGRSLMVKLNCVGCHNVASLPDGKKVGPSLNAEASRVNREWLVGFLKRPGVIKPEYVLLGSLAKMPDFRLTDEEAMALADYMGQVLVDASAPADLLPAPPPRELVNKGEGVFHEKQCHNCHRIGLKAGGIGPELTNAEQRLTPGWVYRFILNPSHYLETRMPNLQVSEEDAKAITAYLMSRKEP